jgi:hypothetical protein
MKIKESISISRSPEEIWDFWLLVSTDIQWRAGFTKAEWTTQPPHGVGSAGVHYHEKLGAMPWTILKWEKGSYFEFIHNQQSKLKGSIASYRVEPENEGSLVTLQAHIVVPFFMQIITFFMRGKMVKGLKSDLQKLKEVMEK